MAHRTRQTVRAEISTLIEAALNEIAHGFETLNNLREQGLIQFDGVSFRVSAAPAVPDSDEMRCAHCGSALRSRKEVEEHRCAPLPE